MGEFGIAPDYVLYHMEPFEASALLSNRDMARRDAWERARMVAYVTAQANATKPLSPADVLPLPWDDVSGVGANEELTAEQRSRLEDMTNQMEILMNGK